MVNEYVVGYDDGRADQAFVTIAAGSPANAALIFSQTEFFSGRDQTEYELIVKNATDHWEVTVDINVQFDAIVH